VFPVLGRLPIQHVRMDELAALDDRFHDREAADRTIGVATNQPQRDLLVGRSAGPSRCAGRDSHSCSRESRGCRHDFVTACVRARQPAGPTPPSTSRSRNYGQCPANVRLLITRLEVRVCMATDKASTLAGLLPVGGVSTVRNVPLGSPEIGVALTHAFPTGLPNSGLGVSAPRALARAPRRVCRRPTQGSRS
jgi:hypothetical protein